MYNWLFTEELIARALTPQSETHGDGYKILVYDAGSRYAVVLSFEVGQILANGEYYDFGDNMMVLCGLADEVTDNGFGECYLEPLSDGIEPADQHFSYQPRHAAPAR